VPFYDDSGGGDGVNGVDGVVSFSECGIVVPWRKPGFDQQTNFVVIIIIISFLAGAVDVVVEVFVGNLRHIRQHLQTYDSS